MSKLLTEFGGILTRLAESAPRDIQFVAERLHDHAVEERMSATDLRALLSELGYDSISDFCDVASIPLHVARRWERFGVSSEMRAVLLLMQAQRRHFDQVTKEFEAITHVGLLDFLRSRKA